MSRIKVGMNTPWGRAQVVRKLAEGVFVVSTPGHGGAVIEKSIAREKLTKACTSRAMDEYGLYWFEEDCQILLVINERPEWFKGAEGQEKTIKRGLEAYYPEYLTETELLSTIRAVG